MIDDYVKISEYGFAQAVGDWIFSFSLFPDKRPDGRYESLLARNGLRFNKLGHIIKLAQQFVDEIAEICRPKILQRLLAR